MNNSLSVTRFAATIYNVVTHTRRSSQIGTSDGAVAWQRVDSYKAPGDPAMSSGSFNPSSSAAEVRSGEEQSDNLRRRSSHF